MNRKVYIAGVGYVFDKAYREDELWTDLLKKQYLKERKPLCEVDLSPILKNKYMGLSLYAHQGIQAAEYAYELLINKEKENGHKWGVFSSTAFGGGLEHDIKIGKFFLNEGPSGILPSLSMNKGSKVMGDIFAVEHHIEGPNITFTSGYLSSATALVHVFDEINSGILNGAVVIGSESVDETLENVITHDNSFSLNNGACSLLMCNEESINNDLDNVYIAAADICTFPNNLMNHKQQMKKITELLKNQEKTSLDDVGLILYSGNGNLEDLNDYVVTFDKEKENINTSTEMYDVRELFGDMISVNFMVSIGIGKLLLDQQYTIENSKLRPQKMHKVLIVGEDISTGTIGAIVLQR